MVNLICLMLAVSAAPEVEFRLDNGLKVILIPQPGHAVAVVALGIRAGTYTDPEGRCGLSHLAEHIFWYAASKSYPAYRAFETVSRDGPLGIPLQDTNAETLPNLTYFYTTRPIAGVDVALEVFAEKLNGITVTPELIDMECKKVLAEIEQVQINMKNTPAIRKLSESEARYPKVGIASHVKALTAEHINAYIATHYRPDRAVLVVQGAFDVDRVRKKVEVLFGPCRAQNQKPIPDIQVKDVAEQVVATYHCENATDRERAALRVAAAAWELELRKQGKAYVEISPAGEIRAIQFGSDPASIQKTRDALHQPLPEDIFRQARQRASEKPKRYKYFVKSYGDPQKAKDLKQCTRIMIQSAIDRLRFEAEGGQESLNLIDELSAEDVANAGRRFLTKELEQVRHVKP